MKGAAHVEPDASRVTRHASLIEFQRVGKRFGGHYRTPGVSALRDVNLSIPAGTVWGVVGPNGAGKSTLFALLLGFLKPTAGSVRIQGLEPRDYTRAHGAGYLPERFRLPPGWSVRGALEALASLERSAQPSARVDEVLHQFGLDAHAQQTIASLSRGTLQRVGLAQALMAQHQLVVLDEPTEGLDPLWRLRFREMIAQLRQTERTILMASHDLAEIERLVDHVVLLADGAPRDTFAIAPPSDGPRRYRITLQAPLEQIGDVLGQVDFVDGQRAFVILVRDTHDLSARLAALLALGAIVESVVPADGLEQRVRDAFRTEPAS
ncbi:MAG: ABC transporter ATP-binding protein [Longimicrobiales bacterium]